MIAGRSRLKVGDVLELDVGGRASYIQYIGTHSEYGAAIVVQPQNQGDTPATTEEYFADGYVTFYPVGVALSQGLVKVVGNARARELPRKYRRAGVRSGAAIETWVIEGDGADVVTSSLSREELALPIASMWNHALLVQRIAEGWSPTQVGGDEGALNVTAPQAAPTRSSPSDGRTVHYLYVRDEATAKRVARELASLPEVAIDLRQSALGGNWLIKVRHANDLTSQRIAEIRSLLETLMKRRGGEYDGWEAEI